MERNHVEQYKWRGRVSSLGLSYQGAIRSHIASDHASRSSCKFSGGFSKGDENDDQASNQVSGNRTGYLKLSKPAFFAPFQVIESENAEFAFIHDSSEIRYEVTKNCNLTEVGEVFAEQPYAIAVQQGSHLQEEISRKFVFTRGHYSKGFDCDCNIFIYIDYVSVGFWTCRRIDTLKCWLPNTGTNRWRHNVWILTTTKESLWKVWVSCHRSLQLQLRNWKFIEIHFRNVANLNRIKMERDKFSGGVFIATLFGLALAMITLAGEVFYYRKRNTEEKSTKEKRKVKNLNNKIIENLTKISLQMKPAPINPFFEKTNNPPRVSHISVYPRNLPFKEWESSNREKFKNGGGIKKCYLVQFSRIVVYTRRGILI